MLIFLALPLILISALALTGAHILKVLLYGDFLRNIEIRINKILEPEAKHFSFEGNRVLAWEYWRINHWYVKKNNRISEITFSTLVMIACFIITVFAVFLRVNYIIRAVGHLYFYIYILIFMGLLFCLVLGYFSISLIKKIKKSRLYIQYEDVNYYGN
jgi:hypothetical protein